MRNPRGEGCALPGLGPAKAIIECLFRAGNILEKGLRAGEAGRGRVSLEQSGAAIPGDSLLLPGGTLTSGGFG